MQQLTLTQLRFVGGPFDGFSQQLFDEVNELPSAVALPLDDEARQLFGIECDTTDREAIYVLHHDDDVVRYQFHKIRRVARPKTRQFRVA